MNHTIFVSRADRMAVTAQIAQIRDALAADWPVTLFPEGTTGDGTTLLPFKAALLAAPRPAPARCEGPTGPHRLWRGHRRTRLGRRRARPTPRRPRPEATGHIRRDAALRRPVRPGRIRRPKSHSRRSPPPHGSAVSHSKRVFPREGGGPVWTPAFAGEQGREAPLFSD
ncbi:1-acyl-sn-glycerol-3-phosphate acyltransferase [Sphingomonas sp. H160509]|uniref:1-acyl-sn-glycerol-3-phosphate acyltransferase n=1 Tax=Sphingomonas sp. H160509 TaxID=2955313 RepID=UPI0031595099